MPAYAYIDTPLGKMTGVIDKDALKHLYFPPRGNDQLQIPPHWVEDQGALAVAFKEISAYFRGELKSFSIVLNPYGTDFQKKVWNALLDIPYGTTVSYQQIAEHISSPKACRAVGGAVGRNPIPIIIPCHRVIGKNGDLTGFSSGLDIKKYLLSLEKIIFN